MSSCVFSYLSPYLGRPPSTLRWILFCILHPLPGERRIMEHRWHPQSSVPVPAMQDTERPSRTKSSARRGRITRAVTVAGC